MRLQNLDGVKYFENLIFIPAGAIHAEPGEAVNLDINSHNSFPGPNWPHNKRILSVNSCIYFDMCSLRFIFECIGIPSKIVGKFIFSVRNTAYFGIYSL